MKNILDVHHLSVVFGKKTIFDNLNYSIKEGQFVALTGINGSGKSTFLKAILSIISYKGHVHLNTESIGYLPQSYSIDRSFPITVEEYVELARRKTSTLDSLDVYESCQILNLKKSFLNELSQGQFQKVLFARSIVNQPQFLILDEPLSNIDEPTAVSLKNLLIELNRKGVTILLSIHDSKFVSEKCDQILSLSQIDSGIIDPCFHHSQEVD